MITPILQYDRLLMIIGRCEEEKFALVIELELCKQENTRLQEEIIKLQEELEKAKQWQTGQIPQSPAST